MADTNQLVFLVTGSDEAGIDQAAQKLVNLHAGENPDAFSLDVIREGDEINSQDAVNQTVSSVLSPPFIGGRKTVWLRRFSGFTHEGKKGGLATSLARLTEVIKAGVPEDIVLIMSGQGVDKRKRFYKTCKEHGTVTECLKPDVKDRDWKEQVRRRILEHAAEKKLTMPPDAAELLADILGTDTARIENEIEKLVTYAGGAGSRVTVENVQELCHGEGSAISWSVRDAIGARDLAEALHLVDVLLRQERDPDGAVIGLVLQTANYIRDLLQMSLFIHKRKIRHPGQVQSVLKALGAAEKAQFLQEGIAIVGYHPYRAKLLAEQAVNFRGNELVEALCILRDTYYNCVSGLIPNRVAYERALVDICGR